MTTDVTSLVMEVDSRQVTKGADDLDKLASAGAKAERATGQLRDEMGRFARKAADADREADKLSNNLNGIGSRMGTLKSFMGGIAGGVFSGLAAYDLAGKAIGAVTGLVHTYVQNTIEAEQVQAQLEARLKSTAGVAGMTKDSLNDLAESLMNMSTFDDEAIGGAEAMLLTFTKIHSETFPRATKAVLDVATAMGTDLQSASIQVGKALNDPIKGVTALARAGIQFSDEQKDVIEKLVKTGETAKAQAIVLDEPERQMGGAAEAARNTLGGSLTALKNSFDNLLEGDTGSSGIQGTRAGIEGLINLMNSGETKQAFATMTNGIASITAQIIAAIPKIIEWHNALSEGLGLQAQSNGMFKGNILDVFKGAGINARGQLAELSGMMRGNAGDVRSARYEKARGAERFRAGVTGGQYDADWSDTGPDGKPYSNQATPWTQGLKQTVAGVSPWRFGQQGLMSPKPAPRPTATGITATGATGGGGGGGKGKTATGGANQLEGVERDLATEEEKIRQSYERRQQIIDDSTKKQGATHDKLTQRNKDRLDKELADLAESKGREIEQLRQSLMTEEESIRASYAERMKIIDENTTLDEQKKQALRDKVTEERDKDLQALKDAKQREADSLLESYMTEEELLKAHHERQRQEILNSTAITEQQRQELLRREEEKFLAESAAREKQRQLMITQSVGDMFGALSQLMAQYAQGNDKNAKRNFKIAQAFGIAQAVISTATGIAKAQELGYPLNIFESIRVGAVGAAQIAAIRSQQFAGGYDQGGYIPAGKWGVVGEYGPEIAEGPMRVTSRRKTAELIRDAQSGDSGETTRRERPPVQVHFHLSTEAQMDDFKKSRRQIEGELGRVIRRAQQ